MQKITPFLLMDGRAEEAMNFYTSVFKNSKIVNVSRAGDNGPVFSATLELDGERFILLNPGPKVQFNEAVSFFINCETQAEVDDLWDKLLAGGGADPVRLAQGQVRRNLAGHPVRAHQAHGRQGPDEGAAGDAGHDEDGQDRHCRPRSGASRRVTSGPAMPATAKSTPPVGEIVVFNRTLDAPRSAVFKAWTDPKQLAQWWGPKGFTNPVCEADPRPGGALYIVMRGPDGTDYPMGGSFVDVAPPERLVFTATVDVNGVRVLETHNTVTLTEQGGKTVMDLRIHVVKATAEATPMLAGMRQGWSQSLERLGAFIGRR
jgi:uncharacterized protein YndB with AHSA1/START domain/uncharacterized glyoxalase superfamily protein PhnB